MSHRGENPGLVPVVMQRPGQVAHAVQETVEIHALVALVQSRQGSDDGDAELSAPAAATRESHSSDVVKCAQRLAGRSCAQ